MHILKNYIDNQIKLNQGKNLFHERSNCKLSFSIATIDLIKQLDGITQKDEKILVNYTTQKVLQEFCRINQYYSFRKKDKNSLNNIYSNLLHNIQENKTSIDSIFITHHNNLKNWLTKTNPFSEKIYRQENEILKPVACAEYSATFQHDILCLNPSQLLEPILDIGCGKEGYLIKNLRKIGLEAYGIDRFTKKLPYTIEANWLEFDYGIKKWGTIISHLGFSNHFAHNHLRKDGNFTEYAQKYIDILNSLKTGGRFHYAPDLPFIEQYLGKDKFNIEKHKIENLQLNASVIKRLK